MGVILAALDAVWSVVCIHDCQNLIQVGGETVVVFIPDGDDCIAALFPRRGTVDRRHQGPQGQIADVNQGGIQASLRAIGNRIKGALRATVAASVLVIALVRRDKRQVRNVTGSQIIVEAALAFEADNVGQAIVRVVSVLDTLEIHERVVFRGVEFEKAANSDGRRVYSFSSTSVFSFLQVNCCDIANVLKIPRHGF